MDDALIKRVLPHSLEAEQSVIGSMLMDREAIITASEIVTADDFYQHQYGVMYESMVELFNEGKPVDLVTLQNRLKGKGCTTGSVKSGVCPGYHHDSTDFGQCEILCYDCKRKGGASETDPG